MKMTAFLLEATYEVSGTKQQRKDAARMFFKKMKTKQNMFQTYKRPKLYYKEIHAT